MSALLRIGSRGEAVEDWQRILQSHGFGGGILRFVDGIFGGRTDSATRQFQERHGLMVNGVVNAATREAASKSNGRVIVRIAEGELKVKETSKNQGPGIEKYWPATNYPEGYRNREPWCAAFAAWCVREAGLREGWLKKDAARPRSAAVREWVPAALRLGWEVFGPRDGLRFPSAGDVVVFTSSHMGIVTDFDGTWVHTIEGNTNAAGNREGKFVMRHQRVLGYCRSFIRLPKPGDAPKTGRIR
jgi:peptidoglycan hydrolase-like protein with peptidoglycan-binding domain